MPLFQILLTDVISIELVHANERSRSSSSHCPFHDRSKNRPLALVEIVNHTGVKLKHEETSQ
jgi:hypothetical protein